MKIGATPYFPSQTTHQASRMPALSTDDNQQSDGSESSALDFTTMSRSNLRDTVNSLIKSGQLSLYDSTGLIGMMAPAATAYAGPGGVSAATYDSLSFDALSALRMAIDGAKSRQEHASAASFARSLTALQQFQGTVTGLDLKV
jgi:hypothetical protein